MHFNALRTLHDTFLPVISKRRNSLDQLRSIGEQQKIQSLVKIEPPSSLSTAMPRVDLISKDMITDQDVDVNVEVQEDVLDQFTNHKESPFFDSVETDDQDTDEQRYTLFEQLSDDKGVSTGSTNTIGNSTDVSDVADEETSEEENLQPPPASSTQSKSNRKKTPQKSRGRIASEPFDNVAEEQPPKRSMRERNFKQEHPYQVDKAHFDLSRKNGGQEVGSSDIEEAVKSTQRNKARQAKGKQITKTKTSTAKAKSTKARDLVSSSRSPSVLSIAAASLSPTLDEDQVLENTTFTTYLVGDPETVIDIGFAECQTVTSPYEQLEMTWGQLKEGRVSQVRYILPWKSETTKHVLAANWDGAFELMVKAIHRAPAWGKKGAGELEVKLEVVQKD